MMKEGQEAHLMVVICTDQVSLIDVTSHLTRRVHLQVLPERHLQVHLQLRQHLQVNLQASLRHLRSDVCSASTTIS